HADTATASTSCAELLISTVFCSMPPPPPTSTPLPYTTLFRSALCPTLFSACLGAFLTVCRSRRGRSSFSPQCLPVFAGRFPASRDRKSTRLNSSHVKISYAVFCLKKKSKTKQAPRPRRHPHTQ